MQKQSYQVVTEDKPLKVSASKSSQTATAHSLSSPGILSTTDYQKREKERDIFREREREQILFPESVSNHGLNDPRKT